MISRHDNRAQALDRICRYLLAHGLGPTSLRQLAAAAGVSDRMLLYYFNDKAEILTEALQRLVMELTTKLEQAFPPGRHYAPRDLFEKAAATTRSADIRPYMVLWIEVSAASARGQQPFSRLTRPTLAGFHAWVLARLAPPPGDAQSGESAPNTAAFVLAALDGLALLDAGSDTLGDLALGGLP